MVITLHLKRMTRASAGAPCSPERSWQPLNRGGGGVAIAAGSGYPGRSHSCLSHREGCLSPPHHSKTVLLEGRLVSFFTSDLSLMFLITSPENLGRGDSLPLSADRDNAGDIIIQAWQLGVLVWHTPNPIGCFACQSFHLNGLQEVYSDRSGACHYSELILFTHSQTVSNSQ